MPAFLRPRLLALVLLVAVGLGISACTALHDSPQAKICRGIIPAINAADARISIRRIEPIEKTENTGRGVVITYVAATSRAASGNTQDIDQRLRVISCVYALSSPQGQPNLLALATERGLVGDVRLHLLKRNWIDRGHAATHDPDPVSMLDNAPNLPRAIGEPLQQVLFALPAIGLYGMLAAAFALLYGLIGRIVLVFGEISVIAATAAYLGFHLGGGYDSTLSAVMLFAIVGLGLAATLGWGFGRIVLDPLAKRPGQHILIASVGLAIASMEALRLLQGTGTKWLSPLLARPLGVARMDGLVITTTPMACLVFVLAMSAAAALLYGLAGTRFGRAWRAVAEDRFAASLCGVDPRQTLLITTVVASVMAGGAGLLATLHYGAAGQGAVLTISLKALIAAIIGGIGSVPGAFAGGIMIGLAEALWAWLFPIEFRDAALYVGLAILLVLRPTGLFGDNQPAAASTFDKQTTP